MMLGERGDTWTGVALDHGDNVHCDDGECECRRLRHSAGHPLLRPLTRQDTVPRLPNFVMLYEAPQMLPPD